MLQINTLLLFPLLLLSMVSLQAQNAVFVPFGQSVAEVKEYVESRSYYREISYNDSLRVLTASNAYQESRFLFFKNRLYAINDIRVYENRKKAVLIIDSCMDYMKQIGGKVNNISSKEFKSHSACLNTDRIVELKTKNLHKGKNEVYTQVWLCAMSRKFGPEYATEPLVRELVKGF